MDFSLCGVCPLGRLAARRPDALFARLWRWHTGWCPGYRAHQRALRRAACEAASGAKPPTDGPAAD